jgi:ABC-type branched-subunit amino acid transport system substrate-binding protein
MAFLTLNTQAIVFYMGAVLLAPLSNAQTGKSPRANASVHVGVVLDPDGETFLTQRNVVRGIEMYFKETPNIQMHLIRVPETLEGQKLAAEVTIKNGFHYVIGHNKSTLSEAYLRALPADSEVTYVTPLATSSILCAIRKDVYLVWPDNERQIRGLVNFVFQKKVSFERVITVVDESATFSTNMSEVLSKELANRNIKSDEHISFISGGFNARGLAEKIAAQAPTLLFLPVTNRELVALYHAIWEAYEDKSLLPVVIAPDTPGPDANFYKMLGTKVTIPPGTFFFSHGFAREMLTTSLKDFAARYEKIYGGEADASVVAGYEAAELLHTLIQSPKQTASTPTVLRTPRGIATVDSQNHLKGPLVINEITNTAFILRETIRD